MLASLSIGFLFGVLAILASQGLLLYFFVINKLNLKIKNLQRRENQAPPDSQETQLRQSLESKQGVVWVLEPEKVPKTWQDRSREHSVSREQKRKREFYEVSPIKKHAKLKNQQLLLKESDGSQTVVPLKSCTIEAVSSTTLASRKWAKRFPLKLESKTAVIYKGSKIFYIYLETSWEKESWCKALRSASCDDKEKFERFAKLQEQFQCYLTLLNAGYPSFMKYSGVVSSATEPADRANRTDGSSSKVRLFLKKFSKKNSRFGPDNKLNGTSSLGRDERKIHEKFRPCQDSVSETSSSDPSPPVKRVQSSTEVNTIPAIPPSSTFSHSGSQSQSSVISDAESDEKLSTDEGTLCLNLLLSRLFFDAKNSLEIERSIQALIQRTLSNMRTPSYMGDVICTNINIGNLPPYIHGMRVVPMDMSDVWALEIDIGYYGGAMLDIETRLEVCELDFPKGIGDAGSDSGSARGMSTDLFEEFEYFGKHLNLVEGTDDIVDPKECDPKPGDCVGDFGYDGSFNCVADGLNISKSNTSASSNGSRWKSLLNSLAKQVSQVPLSLAIRITSLRGTLRLHIKPPPSDRLWFGFTSMPDIDFNLDSSVGDHKITSGRIALFLISRFKAAIREILVLPNFENVCIPWMLAEKDDWVPRKVAPFIWVNQESTNDSPTIFCDVPTEERYRTESGGGTSGDHSQGKNCKLKQADSVEKRRYDPTNRLAFSVGSKGLSAGSSNVTSRELRTPLLVNGEPQENHKNRLDDIVESQSPSRSIILLDKQSSINSEDDDSKQKRVGRRARMLDLGKKVGEKLEEKRRSIEEKSRNIVEKMRGP